MPRIGAPEARCSDARFARGAITREGLDRLVRLAIQVPELVLRTEPAHREAFIHLGRFGQIGPAQYQLITQSLLDWVQEHTAQPIDLGARMTFLADATVPELETKGPDCDFALPIK